MQAEPPTLPHTRSQRSPEKGDYLFNIFDHFILILVIAYVFIVVLVFQLLKRNASSRLGAGAGDATEVQVRTRGGVEHFWME